MDLATVTVNDFKSQFSRDFPFLPEFDIAKYYNIGAEVYYTPTTTFYKALANATVGILPTVGASWAIFLDDDVDNYISDGDINRAFAEAQMNFNQALFGSDAEIKLAYLYMTAHYLVMDIRTARAGVNSSGENPLQSRSVGSVSESYALPQSIIDDPVIGYFAKTGYGQKFLSFALPKLVGNVVAVGGATLP